MSQLLLCRLIKIARYSVAVDPNDVSYSEKQSRLLLLTWSSEKRRETSSFSTWVGQQFFLAWISLRMH